MLNGLNNTENKNIIANEEISNNKKNEIKFNSDEANNYLKIMWKRRSRMQYLSN